MRTFITLGALLMALAVALGQVEPRGENPAIRVNTLLGPTGLITVPTSTTTRVERFQLGTAFGKDIRTVSVNWGIFDSIESAARSWIATTRTTRSSLLVR
jgi:hypothetical protein